MNTNTLCRDENVATNYGDPAYRAKVRQWIADLRKEDRREERAIAARNEALGELDSQGHHIADPVEHKPKPRPHTPTLYRDENGNHLSVEELLKRPDAWDCWHRYALKPEPDEPILIGTKQGSPVYLVTDVGGTLQSEGTIWRRVAYRLPDGSLHTACLEIPCTIPVVRQYRGDKFYLVHNVTSETLKAMKPVRRPPRPSPSPMSPLLARLFPDGMWQPGMPGAC